MAYLLLALTFLATILFYSLFPRSDGIELVDKPMAQTAIFEFVAQHNAALAAATVTIKAQEPNTNNGDKYYSIDEKETSENHNRMQYELTSENWPKFTGSSSNREDLQEGVFGEFLPAGFRYQVDGLRPETYVLCVNNKKATADNFCGVKAYLKDFAQGEVTNSADYDMQTNDFLITIMSKEAIGVSFGPHVLKMLERALGEQVYLTNYDHNIDNFLCYDQYHVYECSGSEKMKNRAHLTTNCGIIACKDPVWNSSTKKWSCNSPTTPDEEPNLRDYDPYNAEYILTNTRYRTVTLPRTFTNRYNAGAIGHKTHIACITELKATYAGCCDDLGPITVDLTNTQKTPEVQLQEARQARCGVTADDGKYGCFWDTTQKKCRSICDTYKSVSSHPNDCSNSKRYGCALRTQNGGWSCENICGSRMIYPKESASKTGL